VLVTGAAGMLGQDLLRHLDGRHDVTGVDLEVDVTDAGAVRA
jgi:nucleoside-diphosphate-sugar epimerase